LLYWIGINLDIEDLKRAEDNVGLLKKRCGSKKWSFGTSWISRRNL
jgi:hypothetical protein